MKSLADHYLTELKKHSFIEPYKTVNPDYERDIKKSITDFIISKFEISPDNEIIFCHFLPFTNFDFVLIEQTKTALVWYYLPEANPNKIKITETPLNDTGDQYKQYFNIDISPLPAKIQAIIRTHNKNTKNDIITAHRCVASLLYNISGLDIHHVDYMRYNKAGELERLKTTLNINLLLPSPREFHLCVLHAYINDCISPEDIQGLTEASNECIEALKNYAFPCGMSCKDYKADKNTLNNLLADYKNKASLRTLARTYDISTPTIIKLIKTYRPILKWI